MHLNFILKLGAALLGVLGTAGKADRIVLSSNRTSLDANGEDLAYITVKVVDKHGVEVPTDERAVKSNAPGHGQVRATANGDPTSLRLFHLPEMDLFSGAATAIVQSGDKPGSVTLKVTAKGLKPASITIPVK